MGVIQRVGVPNRGGVVAARQRVSSDFGMVTPASCDIHHDFILVGRVAINMEGLCILIDGGK